MERKEEATCSGCGEEELLEFDKMSSDERMSKLLQLLFDRITRDETTLLIIRDRLLEYSKMMVTCIF